jgi:glycosyltransferase involved in cell wall biosynthesis
MRILFLLTQDLESPSGLGRYLPLAKELGKLGNTVNIAALHSNYDSLDRTHFEIDGVQVDYVAQMHIKKLGNQKSFFSNSELFSAAIRATWKLSRKALKTQADIIHIAKPHPMNSMAGLITQFLRNCTLYLDCDDYEAGSGNFQNKWQQKVVTFFEKQVPKGVKIVTTNTMFMKENLIQWGVLPERIVYLPNGVDRERFSPPAPANVEILRKNLGLEKKKVIAYIGTLSLVSHPVDLLIEAFPIVKQTVPESVLLLVGGGEDIEKLKRQAREIGIIHDVHFCGRVPPDTVPQYYALADVSVDPVYDNPAARGRSPLKLFESWACGVPFVTADVGDRRQLMGNPQAGMLAHPGDPVSLAQDIIHVLSNPDQKEILARLGLEQVQKYYWDQLARIMESVYLSDI